MGKQCCKKLIKAEQTRTTCEPPLLKNVKFRLLRNIVVAIPFFVCLISIYFIQVRLVYAHELQNKY